MCPRIDPVEPPYDDDVAEDFDELMPEGMEPLAIFRTVANNPRVLRRMRRGGLLDRGSIEPREREIVILRTCANNDCEYEWGVHVTGFSRAVGLTDEQIAATVHRDERAPAWDDHERLLIRLADELHETNGISDELWAELEAVWSPAQLVELVMLAGLYHAVCFTANAFALEPEPLGERFPEQD